MKYSPIIVLVTIAALLGTGCKKENNHSQRFSELLGKWQLTDYGVDSNRNGILESNEYITVPGDQLAEDEYYEDGTGKHYLSVSGGGSWKNDFKWSLEDADQTLTTVNNPGSNNEQIIKYPIYSLTSKELIFTAVNSTGDTSYLVFAKQ